MTILVVTGSLLTVANIGDSEAVLDTGLSILEMTRSHRLQVNLQEQARLKKANYQLAPYGFHLQGPSKPGEQGVGPIRVWPGGLCVSRSVGDGDVGPEVVPLPHIRQVLVPAHGCRLILGSDGLWDIFRFSKAVQITRKKDTSEAAWELMEVAGRNYRVIDDTSVIIVDIIPADKASFPASVASLPASAAPPPQGGGFFACCGPPEEPEPCSLDEKGLGFLAYFNDFDTITVRAPFLFVPPPSSNCPPSRPHTLPSPPFFLLPSHSHAPP